MRSLTLSRRRRLTAAAAFYAASAWLLVQIATQVFPFFNIPNWSVRLIIIAVIVVFPFAMGASWFYEWTPARFRRGSEAGDSRLIAAGQPIAAGALAEPAPNVDAHREQSIAVLPFVDMSERKDQEYFSDGLSEELLNLLAQLPQLRVIARTSSFSFRGKDADVGTIARALNVATVLDGSVRKSGNMLRVTAQLIRASDSSHLWSQTFDRELSDVFKVQDEIAGAVIAALKLKLLPNHKLTDRHRTGSVEAHDQYLLGRNVFRRGRYDDSRRALAAFQRAIVLDSGYAAAFAGMARARSAIADFSQSPAQRSIEKTEALAAAETAIALSPDLADGYVVRAQMRYRQAWDWKGAVEDFQRALALEPNNSDVLTDFSLALMNLGRLDEALDISRRAIDSDPLSWLAWTVNGNILQRKGRVAEARAAAQRALDISPDSSFNRTLLGWLDLEEGNAESALDHFRHAGEGFAQAGIALAEHSLGHEDESARALKELKAKYAAGFSFQIAQACAWRGDRNGAFEWLDRACEQHDSGLARLRGDPVLKMLDDDPRYAALVRKLGFPQ